MEKYKGPCGLSYALSYAFSEWLLMFLLFVNALFSYMVTKFAKYCKLETPCLFCSRLDHILDSEGADIYKNLICSFHKVEISSLAYCHIHQNLAHVRDLCESCLLSFPTEKKSNREAYRSLVVNVKINKDRDKNIQPMIPEAGTEATLQNYAAHGLMQKSCSCCNDCLNIKLPFSGLLETRSIKAKTVKPSGVLLSLTELRSHTEPPLDKLRLLSSVDHTLSPGEKQDSDNLLPHFGHSKLTNKDDSESEAQVCDDKNQHALHENKGGKKIFASQSTQTEFGVSDVTGFQISSPDKGILDQMVFTPSVAIVSTVAMTEKQIPMLEPSAIASLSLTSSAGNELKEVGRNEVQENELSSNFGIVSERASLEATHSEHESGIVSSTLTSSAGYELKEIGRNEVQESEPSSDFGIIPERASLEATDSKLGMPQQIPITEQSDVAYLNLRCSAGNELKRLSRNEVQENEPSSHFGIVSEGAFPEAADSKEKQILMSEPSDVASFAVNKLNELCRNEVQANEPPSCLDVVSGGCCLEATDSEDVEINDAPSGSSKVINDKPKTTDLIEPISKSGPIANDVRTTMSGVLDLNDTYKLVIGNTGYESSPRDPSRAQEDLRLLLSQLSSARGLDFPWNEMSPSPRVHGIFEETKSMDGLGSGAFHIITNRPSIERNESGLSSFDGSIFSEIEGESTIDRLKRLVEFEKKSLIILYKELEEERNASAIAANQAMAMITRLQEEKAAMNMEALHYQRMMEEQAEYDHAALQKSNDMLSEKEKEVEDLKFEISTYRKQFNGLYNDSFALAPVDDAYGKLGTSTSAHGVLSGEVHKSSQIGSVGELEKEREEIRKDILLDLDDERIYISKCLKKLEKRLHLFSNNGIYADMSGYYSGENGMEIDHNEGKILGNSLVRNHFSDMDPGSIQIEKDSEHFQTDSGLSTHGTNLPLSFDLENHVNVNYPPSPTTSSSEEQDRHFGDVDGESSILNFETEISQLSDRVKALEADRNFIEHTINSLKNGNEGLRFVQEIAWHLQELREYIIRRKTPAPNT